MMFQLSSLSVSVVLQRTWTTKVHIFLTLRAPESDAELSEECQ